MMRRSVIDKGYYYDESLNMSEDLDLWLRLMNDGNKVANVPDIVLNYRVTENFPAKRSDQTQREYMKLVRKKNFCSKHMLHSVLSNTAGWFFLHISAKTISKIYNKENPVYEGEHRGRGRRADDGRGWKSGIREQCRAGKREKDCLRGRSFLLSKEILAIRGREK